MTRLLFVLAIVFAIVWWIRQPRRPQDSAKAPTSPPEQALLECTVCQVLIPQSESYRDPQQRPFCCLEHLNQHARK